MKAVEKGKLLFDSGRIDACSLHITQADIYITGIVRAAMKKKVRLDRIIHLVGHVIFKHVYEEMVLIA
jgi:hypothetical protein